MTDARDVAKLIEPIARILLGEPNQRLSSKHELRFGNRGSVSIDLRKGTWFDHERGVGGGVLDLIEDRTGRQGKAQFDWLDEHRLEIANGYSVPQQSNGRGRARVAPCGAASRFLSRPGRCTRNLARIPA